MSRAGDVIENPVTGERAVVRLGTEETGGERLVADLYVSPGGAVVTEHVHPSIEERFTVVSGRVGFRLDGRESIAEPGERLYVPAGVAHDWWNAGEEEAHVVVDIQPGARFEDVMYLSRPPRIVQKLVFGALAPIGRLFGYRGSYPEYTERGPDARVEVEPWPTGREEVEGVAQTNH